MTFNVRKGLEGKLEDAVAQLFAEASESAFGPVLVVVVNHARFDDRYVPVVEMLPIQMPSCPRIASTASAASSPPVTVPPTTSPVSLFPRMNSRRMVNACGAAGGQRVRKGEGGGGGGERASGEAFIIWRRARAVGVLFLQRVVRHVVA